ncbi:MAG: GtrA family protein [Patescibacteria group bacterium]
MNLIIKFKDYLFNSKGQIARFLVVGSSSALIDIGLLIFLKEKINFTPVLAVATNQIIIIIYNFLLNKYWSFETRKKPLRQFSRYVILVAFNYFASIILMYLLYSLIGIDYKIVRLVSIGLLFSCNFIAYKHWVYKER